ncbi:hypothetical protein N4G62_07955 [Sphingomonas sanguinis]|uniref:Uncharacterized protein n=1 Tax=Sphingomonas sanguinis TaxID=33051 RepID=A0ABU5LPV3_9SPHN|nr:hypothetical protein [Sphingomonas sanguinis]MDZ7281958.1 hypothetical protein [Sphingomonas sanguinis]
MLPIDNLSGTGLAPTIFSNNRCQMPRNALRLWRLQIAAGGP